MTSLVQCEENRLTRLEHPVDRRLRAPWCAWQGKLTTIGLRGFARTRACLLYLPQHLSVYLFRRQ